MSNYISYQPQNITVTIGFILLILSQVIHILFINDKYIHKIVFILSYIILIIGIILERNKINIVNFSAKIIVIILVSIGMYKDYIINNK